MGTEKFKDFQICLRHLINLCKSSVDLYDIFFICDFELRRNGLDTFRAVLMEEVNKSEYAFRLPFDKNLLESGHMEYLISVTEDFYKKRNRNLKILGIVVFVLGIYLLLTQLFGIL